MFDVIIRGGRILDGTGTPWYYGDIGIMGDRIAAVGRLDGAAAGRVIAAEGKYVSPGFIDAHSHSDLVVLSQPDLAPKLRQGITTEILGQDGISVAPVNPGLLEPWRRNISGLNGTTDEPWDWTDVDGYLTRLAAVGSSANLAYLVGHGNIRMTVMGLDSTPASAAQLAAMTELLAASLEQGAVGMSTGLIYPPCVYATREEMVALCRVLARYGAPLVVHQRSEGDEILESMEELFSVCRETGAPLHISHFKVCGKDNWPKVGQVIASVRRARAEGLDVTFDQYPYTAGSTLLSAILPPWMHDGGTHAMLERLQDPALRERCKAEMAAGLPGWDSIARWAGWEGIRITSVESEANAPCVGRSIREIAAARGTDPADTALDLILAERNSVGMVDFVVDEAGIRTIIREPYGMICTDGLLLGKPHPRSYGAFPKVLRRYVREEAVLTLEDAVRKMTSLPARRFGLVDRGLVREGCFADLVVFDAETVADTSTYDEPRSYPTGIEYVLVNGTCVVTPEGMAPAAAGAVLRRQYGQRRLERGDEHPQDAQ